MHRQRLSTDYRIVVRSPDLGLCVRCKHREGNRCRSLGIGVGAACCAAYKPRRGRPPKAGVLKEAK